MFERLLEIADDHLILGHRLSELTGHAPTLEEELALPNIALDLIGQARALYEHAGIVEGKGRSEDDLAYLRPERAYRHCLLVERPNQDFAHVVLRQLYFSAFMAPYWHAAQESEDDTVAGIAGKAVKEARYHIRHAGEWVIRLGDGTEESAARMAEAVAELTRYTPELFEPDDTPGLPDPAEMRGEWDATIAHVFHEAKLELPEVPYPQTGGRAGRHGEVLGHLLAELQYMQRAYPGATW
ncbi:1,2-phenylacetyl-CoA epoxidase subunit PaaC [Pontivivens ytuae]|uniref:Phenylacetate-CoA oxygenase subunit PaaC n=1 Tax=Pontivivens ytuae TaxID=2789856 RepID=A0A7S9LNF6_9RHOB|nr:1,2-phenylacetyl-CoA epoxidase subunit PaaC [Pontivivens ytuae]QPH52239.1 phenylacetate-CoA oxygenase subunit PaaC [Pontivivens ytuae]